MGNKFDMVCILGATATGKTSVAVELARLVNGEIISADSRQVYRGMDIGTGKDLAEYRSGAGAVQYHLIDIVEPGYEFNLFEYRRMFLDSYCAIRGRGGFPILCGGTGLYIDAVLNRYQMVEVPVDEALRSELEKLSEAELAEKLASYRVLHNTTDTMDRKRLIRALEIAVHSRDSVPVDFPAITTAVFGLRLDRDELRRRITVRLKDRLANGMVEEVKRLMDEGVTLEQLDFYGLEYRYLARYVNGTLNRNDMFQKLNAEIYQFARRQEKWYRRMERNGITICWLSAREDSVKIAETICKELLP